jgi:hypothetical protein
VIALKIRILSALVSVVSATTALAVETMPTRTTEQQTVQMNLPRLSGDDFSDFYSDEANYRNVYRSVMSWFGTTSNACVAFASTALRMMGVNVPQNGVWNGERLSLLTKPFSQYLENKLGWDRINNSRDLEPGDLVFTVDEPKAPGYPAHVFMHSGYADDARTISWAVDNQGFTHTRALAGDIKKDYSAFAYALRWPAQ